MSVSSPMDLTPKILRTVGRYELQHSIGGGGMGELYLARDPAIDRLVAIKVLREGLDNAEVRERFTREARSAGRLRHRNIVTIFDVGEHDGKPFIAMEYIVGETLDTLIRRSASVSLGRRLEIIEELCSALQYAHEAGIVHRDVKPSNVMLDGDGTVKILDFGIARVGASGMTRGIIGTLNYMAPEQMEGKPVDARADIFALGALFYELIAYRRAFPGDVEDGILTKILVGRPEPLDSLVPGLDPSVVRIVNRCLEKAPSQRYPSCREVASEVLAARQQLQGSDLTVPAGRDELDVERRASLEKAQIHEWVAAGHGELQRGALTAASLLVERALSLNSGSPEALALRSAIDEARTHLAEAQARTRAEAAVADARRVFAAGDHDGALDQLRRFRPPHVVVSLAIDELQIEANEILRRAATVRVTAGSRSEAATVIPPTVAARTAPAPVRVERRPTVSKGTWIAAAAAGALVVVSTAVVLWRGSRQSPTPVDAIATNPPAAVPAPAAGTNPPSASVPVETAARPVPAPVQTQPPVNPKRPDPIETRPPIDAAPPPVQPTAAPAVAPVTPPPVPAPAPPVSVPADPPTETRTSTPAVQPPPTGVAPLTPTSPPPRPDINAQTPRWARVPEGTFMMGCVPQDPNCYPNESPRHSVLLKKPFDLMATEVTLGMFRAYASANRRNPPNQPSWNVDDRQPIVNLSWEEAAAFCASVGGRLPTEAEWEHAARGQASTIYPWGDAPPRGSANGTTRARLAGGGAGPWPVGSFEPNGFGLYDMAGNVWEWVSDRNGPYTSEEVIDPKGPPSARGRIVRGGSWNDGPRLLRISNRGDQAPASGSNSYIGARCARNVSP